jgi:hypothetical protein
VSSLLESFSLTKTLVSLFLANVENPFFLETAIISNLQTLERLHLAENEAASLRAQVAQELRRGLIRNKTLKKSISLLVCSEGVSPFEEILFGLYYHPQALKTLRVCADS